MTIAREAIIARIDILEQANREIKDGIITIEDGKNFRRGYNFDTFIIEMKGLTVFIPASVLPLMNEMLERRLAKRAAKAETTNANTTA